MRHEIRALKHGTPLMCAAAFSKSPAVVVALMKANANLEATEKVRYLEDNRCDPYVLIDHARVR